MVTLSVEYIPPHDLQPYGRNARTHSRKQIRQIADSVRVFGFTNPILIDSQNMILAGHGRVEEASLHGPVVRLKRLQLARLGYVHLGAKPAREATQYGLGPIRCRKDGR
jgi:hypothetical protein